MSSFVLAWVQRISFLRPLQISAGRLRDVFITLQIILRLPGTYAAIIARGVARPDFIEGNVQGGSDFHLFFIAAYVPGNLK